MNWDKRRLLWLIVLLWGGGSASIRAQSALEITLHYATLWRHTPKLTIQTGQPVWGEESGWRLQTHGRHDWNTWQRFPAMGVSLAHFRLGEQSHGDAFGLLPNLTVPIIRAGHWLALFRLGTGLGYVTQPYDYFNNPTQNAIGSHWNNMTQFRLGVEGRFNPHWRLQIGGVLTHFSNGATALPNFGVNLPGGYATLSWSPAGIREETFVHSTLSKHGGPRWGGQVQGGLARIEYSVFDGPRYPIWMGSVAGYYHFSRVSRLLLGVDYEYNHAVYAWGLASQSFNSEKEARRGSTRLAVFLADEFLFGDLGVQLQAGAYTGKAMNRYTLKSWYGKLTARYYLPAISHTSLRPYTGIALKAHATTAEYIAVTAGFVF